MINPENMCHLVGCVQGEIWTRWRKPSEGQLRGQVRFWLRVSRELAGDGTDCLLCAIEPHDAAELKRYESELRDGRTVQLEATARSCPSREIPDESAPGVVFVAESCGFDGQAARPVHQRPPRPHGKMAAAGDNSVELPLEGSK